MVDHPTFTDTSLRLDPGDVLLLYTDGVTEGRRGRGAVRRGTPGCFRRARGPEPAALVPQLVDEVLDFQDGTLRDDVAVVAVGPLP